MLNNTWVAMVEVGGGKPKGFERLIPFRVHDILLVSSPYDHYVLEEDGLLSDLMRKEYQEVNFSQAPRITHSNDADEALELMERWSFQLVITMARVGRMRVEDFGKAVKKKNPELPVVLLAHNTRELATMGSSKFIERKLVNEEYYLDNLNIKPSQNKKYPLERNNKIINDFSKKNLILIIVESLSYKYLDYFSKNNFGATPNLDKLSEEGLIFLNFFANGQRSVEGIQSILTGIPSLPGIPDITALSVNYPKLGQIAENNGYKPIFITSTLRESFSLDLIAGASGFKEYYGKEDYPILLDYEHDINRPLGWDYESLMYLFTLIKDNDKPI